MRVTRLTSVFSRAKQIYQIEGLINLMRRGLAFLRYRLLEYRTYHLLVHRLEKVKQMNESDLSPKTEDLSLEIVVSNDEADRLEARGLDFRSQARDSYRRLSSGAVAICLFIGNELAHIGWVAMSKQARDSLGETPMTLDFSRGEGCRGGVWTNPKFRRLDLHAYGNFKRLEFMLDKGLVISRDAIAKSNTVVMQTNKKLGAEAYAEGRYLRILWWKSWKEKPLTPDSGKEQSNASD
jgi:hypothetical protein